MRTTPYAGIRLVVFDWTGTLIDHGSLAPVQAMMATFHSAGIELTSEQARCGNGLGKRERIEMILRVPEVLRKFRSRYGQAPNRDVTDALLSAHLTEQLHAIRRCSELIDGATAAVSFLRQRGIAVATTTGYCREAAELVLASARAQGFVPDHAVCAEDLLAGSSAPFMIHACMRALEVYRARDVLVVGDALLGSFAELEGSCARVGVAGTGSEVGLPSHAWHALALPERNALLANAHRTLRDAGAHVVIDSLHELPLVIDHIHARRMRSAA